MNKSFSCWSVDQRQELSGDPLAARIRKEEEREEDDPHHLEMSIFLANLETPSCLSSFVTSPTKGYRWLPKTPTGVFTDGHSRTWALSFSFGSTQYSGDVNQAWLFKNGLRIKESELYCYFVSSGHLGYVRTMGSRILYLYIAKGDQISLGSGSVYYFEDITICFEYLDL